MAQTAPQFTMGIEEEYLLVDRDSLALAPAPRAMMEQCNNELQGQFSPEFLNCQIEIGTKVCANIGEAREDLKHLRSSVARIAGQYNLAPIAASCHPFSDWRDQEHTDKTRYNELKQDLGGVVNRMLICGMHIHIGIESRDFRVDLNNQIRYFLPHLLALSTSSPFWQGHDTKMASYRLSVFDNLPRTGLPPEMTSWSEFERTVNFLVDLGVVEDSSKIWWDIRPSSKFPTIESRICDVSPRLEHALTIAALTQSLTRMLWRLSRSNMRWRLYDTFLINENRWRAQRYGTTKGLIDFGKRAIIPFADLLDEMLELIAQDAEALGSLEEIQKARKIVSQGTSSERQRQVFESAQNAGHDKDTALRAVVTHLIEEFHCDI